MACDSSACGLAEIQTEVHAVRGIERGQDALGLLRQIHELMGCFYGQGRETRFVFVRDDHDMAGCIGIGVEADEAVFAAEDEAGGHFGLVAVFTVGNGVVDGGDEVAEDAAEVAWPVFEAAGNSGANGFFGVGDVAIAPGSPEQIHIGEYREWRERNWG